MFCAGDGNNMLFSSLSATHGNYNSYMSGFLGVLPPEIIYYQPLILLSNGVKYLKQ